MWMNNVGLAERDGPSDTQPPPIGCTDIDDARGRSDGSRAEGEQENYYSFFLKMGPISNINKNCFQNKVAFWNGMMAHGTYDEFWKSRALGPRMTGIKKPAIIVAGSWFDDQDLYGALHTYKAINDQNPEVSVSLIMGPWNHDKWYYQKTKPWGKIGLPVKETGAYYRDKILLPFFNFHLKNKGEITLPKATVFESGTNTWKEYSEWPPKNVNMKQFYLGSQGKLLSRTPHGNPDKFDQFISDPANPVPQIPAEKIHGWTAEVMHWDQRFATQRDDVLVYTGNVLENDLTVAGPVEVSLYVSTTGTDADWVVKLIDVYPDNEDDLSEFQMLVRGDIMRSKFRNSFEKPEPLVPGKITPVTFTMPDINHTFRKGHQLMVQVQSSWFPWFDRNPQQFLDIYKAKEEDFQKATHRVYHSKDHPSHIGLNVLSTSQK
jgi:putative CocE/NonD family hydrolase